MYTPEVPIYHYTSPLSAPLILRGGLRISTKQGQSDGGVSFRHATYGLGSPDIEENIINDCFDKERLDEYRGKHKLDECFVCGVEPGPAGPGRSRKCQDGGQEDV